VSEFGTDRTSRAGLMMSVHRGSQKWRFGTVRTAVEPLRKSAPPETLSFHRTSYVIQMLSLDDYTAIGRYLILR
jgi:hypothetical protein